MTSPQPSWVAQDCCVHGRVVLDLLGGLPGHDSQVPGGVQCFCWALNTLGSDRSPHVPPCAPAQSSL